MKFEATHFCSSSPPRAGRPHRQPESDAHLKVKAEGGVEVAAREAARTNKLITFKGFGVAFGFGWLSVEGNFCCAIFRIMGPIKCINLYLQ